jgi:hypothetical protein
LTATPVQRLALSRERLRLALRAEAAERAAPGWLNQLRALPGAEILLALGRYAATLLQPMAQRHPLRLVLAALVVGGLAAWSRPWRWLPKLALVAGLLPQLLAAAGLNPGPGSNWVELLLALLQKRAAPTPPPSPSP